jgi:hypothetical protein
MAEKVSWQSLLISTGIAALGIFLTQLQQSGIPEAPKKPKAPKVPKKPVKKAKP